MSTMFKRAFTVGAAAAVSTLLFAGCSSNGGSGGGGGGQASGAEEEVAVGPADVTIVNFGYEAEEFTTTAGSTVTWINEGSAPHTVTGEDFDSGVIRTGKGFTQTFDEPGTYEYWCTNHEGMMFGTVIVE